MKFHFLSFFNPRKITRSVRFRKAQLKYDRSAFDLELTLYSNILKDDMLHYGYFDDTGIQPEDISVSMMEEAQIRYAQNILNNIVEENRSGRVLDVGCGTGGLTGMLLTNGLNVEALTPNDQQIGYVRKKYPGLTAHHCKYEELAVSGKFQTIIHSESLQYIALEDAFKKSDKLLDKGGRWIIIDYFRNDDSDINSSGHLLADMKKCIDRREWSIVKETDITQNILPTLKLVHFYANRFALPLMHFGMEKFRFKAPFLFSMTDEIRASIDKKVKKELAAIDPHVFSRDKKYLLLVLKKLTSHD
jgi:cyclopropane fatty-acyl-phospholipid synthase-like methyltransferase